MERKTKVGIAAFFAVLGAATAGAKIVSSNVKEDAKNDVIGIDIPKETTATSINTTVTTSTTTIPVTEVNSSKTETTVTTTSEPVASTTEVVSATSAPVTEAVSTNTTVTTGVTEQVTEEKIVTTEAVVEDKFDYAGCYEIMDEIVNVSFGEFFNSYGTLSDALVDIYEIELTDEQKSRYDNVMKDTYDLYVSAMEAYNNGDMDLFKSICDKIINGENTLKDFDLADILAMNINKQGDYINDSSNYSFDNEGVTIDGYVVKDLIVDNVTKDINSDLVVFELPDYVVNEAIKPSNMTIMKDNTVYAYNPERLINTINSIEQYYCEKLGYKVIGIEVRDGKTVLVGYNGDMGTANMTREIIDESTCPGLLEANIIYSRIFNPNIKIGAFDGKGIHDYILNTKDGENVSVDILVGEKEFFDYASISSVDIPEAFLPFMEGKTLSSVLIDKYDATLTEEQKARYDVIMQNTCEAYMSAKKAYESGRLGEFKNICNDITSGKYLNTDDFVFMLASLVNKGKFISIDKGLPGYHYALRNEQGEVVDEWISTAEPHVIKNLANGNYSLVEVLAPEGYDISEEFINFTVNSNGVVTDNNDSTIKITARNVISDPSKYTIVDGTIVFDEMTIKNGSAAGGFVLPNNLMSFFSGCNNEVDQSRILSNLPVFVSYLANNKIPMFVVNNEALIYNTNEVATMGKTR